jgi:hypothetical protein
MFHSQAAYHLTIPPVNRIEPGFRNWRSAAEPQSKIEKSIHHRVIHELTLAPTEDENGVCP